MSTNETSGPKQELPEWRVVMLGPSRVGKTSLLTALQVAANEYFEGTSISAQPSDDLTSRAFARNNNHMLGELQAGSFRPEMKGTRDVHEYRLTVKLGKEAPSLRLTFVDFPGGYLSDRPSEVERQLSSVSTVIVPIDATLLMESGSEHSISMVKGLNIDEIARQVKIWAKKQVDRHGQVSLVLVPMKCEHYFADNGGRRDRSGELYNAVRQAYDGIVKGFTSELGAGAKSHVLYAPVDTIGPVELIDVSWIEDSVSGESRMNPMYRVRKTRDGRTAVRHVRGAKPVLANLISDLLQVEQAALANERQALAEELQTKRKQHHEEQSHWWSRFTDWIGGDGEKRLEQIEKLQKGLGSVDSRLQELTSSSSDLQGDRQRVRAWH